MKSGSAPFRVGYRLLGSAVGVAFLVVGAPAAPPAEHYADVFGRSGPALRAALHQRVRGHTVLPYSQVWGALEDLDENPANPAEVILLYSGDGRLKSLRDPGNDSQNWWNREHVWPISLGPISTQTAAGTDLFHLFACDRNVNSRRSNLGFDDVRFTPDPEAPESGSDGRFWEPRDADKGRVARAILYVAIRYEADDDAPGVGDLEVAEATAQDRMARLSTLLEWNRAFPPDARERRRNDRVFAAYQRNRNPFIDWPELADRVFLGADPYTAWRATRFVPAERLPGGAGEALADPDADGLANALEFAFGLDPRRPDGSVPVEVSVGPGGVTWVHPAHRGAETAVWLYEWSRDGRTWEAVAAATTSTVVDAFTLKRRATVVVPPGPPAAAHWARVRVVLP